MRFRSTENMKNTFLVNDQRDAQILVYVFISIYNSLHVSSTQCSSSGETNCFNTAPGNSHSENRWVIKITQLYFKNFVNRNKHIEENLCITLVIHQKCIFHVFCASKSHFLFLLLM